MRTIAFFTVVMLGSTLTLSGCQTVRDHPGAAVGAGAGAAGGALLGGLIADSTRGAVVGGLLGALAGGAVGHYVSRQDRSFTEAAGVMNYSPGQGRVVQIEEAFATPAVVRPGQQVNLGARYTVLGPQPQQPLTVHETRVVRHAGEVVANPSAEFARTPGTYTSALPIDLPPNAAPGAYEVTTTIVAGDRAATETTRFTVAGLG